MVQANTVVDVKIKYPFCTEQKRAIFVDRHVRMHMILIDDNEGQWGANQIVAILICRRHKSSVEKLGNQSTPSESPSGVVRFWVVSIEQAALLVDHSATNRIPCTQNPHTLYP